MPLRASLAFLLLSVCLSACYESRLLEPRVVLRDSGVPTDAGAITRDGGPLTPRDAGRPPPRDAAPVECTAPVAPYEGPRCQIETLECLQLCRDDECDDCYASDPPCRACVFHNIVRCANEVACQDLWTESACCAEGFGCGTASPLDVLGCMGCASELDAYGACANNVLASRMDCGLVISERCVP